MSTNAFGFFLLWKKNKKLKQVSKGQCHFSCALQDSHFIKSGEGFEFGTPTGGNLLWITT